MSVPNLQRKILDKSEMLRQKTCCFLSIDMATFVFGVISAVISGCGLITFATVRFWIGPLNGDKDFSMWLHDSNSMRIPHADEAHRKKLMKFTQYMIFMLYLFFMCLVSFLFSVFLCYGTKRRRPGFVKAYLVYGVVAAVLMMARAVLLFATGGFVDGLVGLLVCGIYSWILLVIKRTYEAIRAEQNDISEKMLPEPCVKA